MTLLSRLRLISILLVLAFSSLPAAAQTRTFAKEDVRRALKAAGLNLRVVDFPPEPVVFVMEMGVKGDLKPGEESARVDLVLYPTKKDLLVAKKRIMADPEGEKATLRPTDWAKVDVRGFPSPKDVGDLSKDIVRYLPYGSGRLEAAYENIFISVGLTRAGEVVAPQGKETFVDVRDRALAEGKKLSVPARAAAVALAQQVLNIVLGASPIEKVRIRFEGSFQCRIATGQGDEADPPDSSPTDPYGPADGGIKNGVKGKEAGWTYAYREAKFDRVIRLSNPVDLRNGLIDPWKDTVVTEVQADEGKGFQLLKSDPLMGKVLSFGKHVTFDETAGGGALKEKLPYFKFSLGTTLLTADPREIPQLVGPNASQQDKSWQEEYVKRKPKLIANLAMDPVRKRVLEDRRRDTIVTLAGFFSWRSSLKPVELVNVQYQEVNGVLLDTGDPARYAWELNVRFSRFDGDTLTGRIEGELQATRKAKP